MVQAPNNVTALRMLTNAAERGDVEYVRNALAAGVDPNSEIIGTTALLAASKRPHLAVMKVLLAAGASPNTRSMDDNARSPLNAAILAGSHAAAELLLDHGADPRIITHPEAKQSAAHLLLENYTRFAQLPDGENIVRKLLIRMLDAGVRVNQLTETGDTLLHIAAREIAPVWLLEALLDRSADLGIPDMLGARPLHLAAAQDNPDAVKLFLAHGADPDATDKDGLTALKMTKHPETVKLLIDAGADVNAQDNHGFTILGLWAREGGRSEVYPAMALLLDAGADIDKKDFIGRHCARSLANPQLAKALAAFVAARNARAALSTVIAQQAASTHTEKERDIRLSPR